MSPFPHLADPLTDGGVILRDYLERDIPEILIAYQDDPRLHLLTGEDRPPSGAELGSQAEGEASARAAGTRATLSILEPGSDTFRGQLRVLEVDWDHARAGLAIWLAPQARGRRLGRRALRLAGEWLLGVCRLVRVEMLAEPGNLPLIRAAEAAGFAREGILRHYHRKRAARIDAIVLSMIQSDL